MDTFGWGAVGQRDDVFLPRSLGQLSCGRVELDLDDAFLGACFGAQLHSDGDGVGSCHAGAGTSSFVPFGGGGGNTSGFLSSGVDVFASVLDGGAGGAHDGLLDTAIAFSRALVEGSNAGAVSNGAMLSSYSGTTTGGNISSGESNNYSGGGGGGHDAEVVSPTSTVSPTTLPSSCLPQTTSPQALPAERKLTDDYTPTIATVQPAAPAPALPRPGAKRKAAASATSITFGLGVHDPAAGAAGGYEPDMEAMAQVKEMIYRAAAMRPVNLGAEATADKPRRKNVRISSDPQTVAARLRRERVSERLRVLQKLVPGGSKMDTASMLDEAASYLKFLRSQVQALETLGTTTVAAGVGGATNLGRLQQHHYSNNHGFLGFARNSSNISSYANPNGNAMKLT